MTKQRILANPEEWIITKKGDFVRIKDSEIYVEKKLEAIRERLKKPYKGVVRFHQKSPEQINKERYDKVLEEVNFDYEKFHEWIYDEKNKDKVEIIPRKMIFSGWEYEIDEVEYQRDLKAIFNHVKSSRQKWRIKKEMLVNEETGQIIYFNSQINELITDLRTNWDHRYNGGSVIIREPRERKPKEKHTSTLIFLHGTHGAINQFPELEKNFPDTKFIYPHSPTLQYDMWHGSQPAPGEQCQGWINVTGDVHELMDTDACPNNPPPKKNFEEADQIIHLDYPQLMRAVNYINEIIEQEIANGIPPEKIFLAGYSQGGLLTLAIALTSKYKLGGFASLCGLLPRWDKLLVRPSDQNKATPLLIINNSHDFWVPFWTGKKSHDLLREHGYNVEFKTHPGLGHAWKNEDVVEFLEKCLNKKQKVSLASKATFLIIISLVLIGVIIIGLIIIRKKRSKFRK